MVPWNYNFDHDQYDGVLLSNGPGDPSYLQTTIENVKKIINRPDPVPIMGICLGNQILGLAAGASTYKLSYGNRGHNQPVVDLTTGKTYITSQNHGYALNAAELPDVWE